MLRLEKSTLTLHTLPTDEITRRQEAVKALMHDHHVSVLIIHNTRGCYRTWLTGQNSVYGHRNSGLLWINAQGQIILCGGALIAEGQPNDLVKGALPNPQPIYPHIETRFGFDAAEVLASLAQTSSTKVGIVNGDTMSVAMDQYFKSRFAAVEWVDLTEPMEALRMVRHPVELAAQRRVVHLHEKVMAAVPALIRPLMLESDLVHAIRTLCYHQGSGGDNQWQNVQVTLSSHRQGHYDDTAHLVFPGRRIQSGDQIDLTLRAIGDDEYTAMIGRTLTVGPASSRTQQQWEVACQLTNHLASALKPGVTLKQIQTTAYQFLQQHGLKTDPSCFLHGVGLDLCEAPFLYDKTETVPLKSGMVVAVEPHVQWDDCAPMCCGDVYVVTDSGGQRLGSLPQTLMTC